MGLITQNFRKRDYWLYNIVNIYAQKDKKERRHDKWDTYVGENQWSRSSFELKSAFVLELSFQGSRWLNKIKWEREWDKRRKCKIILLLETFVWLISNTRKFIYIFIHSFKFTNYIYMFSYRSELSSNYSCLAYQST